jgi:uncharacterized protein (DUF1684 family)
VSEPRDTLDLADYRRRVSDLYRRVRDQGGGSAAWEEWVAARDRLFDTHRQSAVDAEGRANFGGLSYFAYDPDLALDAVVEPRPEPPVAVDHSAEGSTLFRPFGVVRVTIGDTPVALTLYWLEGYGGGIFLPFRDASSGRETYGGGRYLLDTVKGADLGMRDGRIVLDFNFAYHPSCVYSARWSCPLAPPDNHLPVPIRAGERLGEAS